MAATTVLCVFAIVAAATLITPSTAQCSSLAFTGNRVYNLCNSLPQLGSSLHWTYHQSNGSVDLAFRAPRSSPGWVAWGINPSSLQMIGTQALVAVVSASGNVTSYTSPITGYSPLQRGNLRFNVSDISATYSGGVITIFATIFLPNNSTRVNQVWQSSSSLSGDVPDSHPQSGDNLLSRGTLNFLSGESSAAGGSNMRRKNLHGILNAISWGVLMPLGVVIARYMRVFQRADPAWFYLHVTCQCSAYVLGVAGWGTGLKLGSESVGITHLKHRIIGIVLFSLATLQVFALFLRPNKDHKRRVYWNAYHHAVGYAVISLSIVNILEGFDVLGRERSWRTVYIGVIGAIGGAAVVLEVITWIIVLKRRRHVAGGKRINGVA